MMLLDRLDRPTGPDSPFDPLGAAERCCEGRECRLLRGIVVRLLDRQSDRIPGELAELVEISPRACLQRMTRALAGGCTAGDLCRDLGIPLSRCRC